MISAGSAVRRSPHVCYWHMQLKCLPCAAAVAGNHSGHMLLIETSVWQSRSFLLSECVDVTVHGVVSACFRVPNDRIVRSEKLQHMLRRLLVLTDCSSRRTLWPLAADRSANSRPGLGYAALEHCSNSFTTRSMLCMSSRANRNNVRGVCVIFWRSQGEDKHSGGALAGSGMGNKLVPECHMQVRAWRKGSRRSGAVRALEPHL